MMIGSVSNARIGNTTFGNKELIERQQTHSKPAGDVAQPQAGAEAAPAKKSKTIPIIGTIVGLAAAAFIALGIAVGKGKLSKLTVAEGQKLTKGESFKNVFASIGETANNLWKSIAGKFAKKAD